jgi:hypothetical protein
VYFLLRSYCLLEMPSLILFSRLVGVHWRFGLGGYVLSHLALLNL